MSAKAIETYKSAVANAEKTLKKAGGALPDPRIDPVKVLTDARNVMADLVSKMDDIEKSMDAAEAIGAKVKAAAKQYADILKDDDFGLGTKDPKNKKICEDVRKSMLASLQGMEDMTDQIGDLLDKIQKAITTTAQGFKKLQ